MLLSTFSHYSLFHLAANMYVLWSFSSSIINMMGKEQFVALYLSAGVLSVKNPTLYKFFCVIELLAPMSSGVISTFFSYVSKTAMGRLGPSLGAVSVLR